jgi:hypothetical protein
MANEYEIARGTGKCAATGRELAAGEFYYAALFETPQGIERKDLSVETWTGPPEGCFCYWKTRVPTREKKPSIIAVDSSLLVDLFCRLEEDSSEMRQKFRFVLALLLMRKRLLRLDKTTHDDGREYWHMRLTGEQSVHQVINPQLSNEEIDRLSGQLAAILSGDSSAISAMEEQAVEEPAATAAEPLAGQGAQAGNVVPVDASTSLAEPGESVVDEQSVDSPAADDSPADGENTRATE